MPAAAHDCLFCKIIRGEVSSHIVDQDDHTLAFLDHRPVFPGHCLLAPKNHIETLGDVPSHLLAPIFARAQRLATAVERALGADGTFVAINNRVSQSVPHLHIHVVPRRRKDGLRGFFWPRQRYASDEEAEQTRQSIAAAMKESE
ncbi:MAG: HIT family protein [Bryobacteraceae bacterium]